MVELAKPLDFRERPSDEDRHKPPPIIHPESDAWSEEKLREDEVPFHGVVSIDVHSRHFLIAQTRHVEYYRTQFVHGLLAEQIEKLLFVSDLSLAHRVTVDL